MNSFWKSFISIFNLFPSPKTYTEQNKELDNQMQDLYDRMGWDKYPYPNNNSSYVSGQDIARILEAEQSFMNEIYGYNTRQVKTTIKKTFSHKRDPARRRVNKYL